MSLDLTTHVPEDSSDRPQMSQLTPMKTLVDVIIGYSYIEMLDNGCYKGCQWTWYFVKVPRYDSLQNKMDVHRLPEYDERPPRNWS